MKVAITGTSGRIGRAIHFALSKQHQVVGIDRTLSSATNYLGEIDDFDLLLKAFKGAHSVVHTAALHAPHVGVVADDEFERVNILGTEQVTRAAKESGVKALVFTSTTALYGRAIETDPKEAAWITEDTVPQPKSIYQRTKLESEEFLATEAAADFKVTTLRMSCCFPEPAPIMAVYRLHRGIDARDVAKGHRLAVENPGDDYRMFILSGNSPFGRTDCRRLKQNAREVLHEKCKGLCKLFDTRGWTLPPSIDRVYDSSRARLVLGWVPQYGFDEVVRLLDAHIPEVLPPHIEVFSE